MEIEKREKNTANLCMLQSIAELKTIPQDVLNEHVASEKEVKHLLRLCDALWLHSGNAKDPHAELTSGKCSNGFVDALRALRHSYLCKFFGDQLAKKFENEYKEIPHPDWVIGSDHAGATFSHSVALALGSMHDFTEKGGGKTQVWKRFDIKPEETVLQVEELITTTSTLQAVREGIRAGNSSPVTFAPVSLTLIHRSPIYEFENTPILYLAHYDITTWNPSDCPLCAQGSKRVRPKQNWKELSTSQSF